MVKKIERNELVCQLYITGQATQKELANRFNVTECRIHQILKAGGYSERDRPQTPKVPRERVAFTGINMPRSVKQALIGEVKREGKSISGLIVEIIRAELERRGVEIKKPGSNADEPPLPFEETHIGSYEIFEKQ